MGVASDDGADVYINGVLVDADAESNHNLRFWNRQFTVDTGLLLNGTQNVIAVFLNGSFCCEDGFFSAMLQADLTCQPGTGGTQCLKAVTTAATAVATTVTAAPISMGGAGLQSGAIAGIVIAVILGVVIVGIVVGVLLFIRRRNKPTKFVSMEDMPH